MSSSGQRELVGHELRGDAGVRGGWVVLFGLIFAVTGGFLVLASIGVVRIEDPAFDLSRDFAGAFGQACLLAGLVVTWSGAAGLVRGLRMRLRQRQRPWEPWYWDHPWDERVSRTGALRRNVADFVRVVVVTVFVAPFCIHFYPYALPFGLLPALGWSVFLYRWLQRLKYGASELHLAHFPFFLGDGLDVSLAGAARLAGYTKLKLTLRCVEESPKRCTGSSGLAPCALYEEERTYGPGELDLGPGRPARLLALLARDSSPLRLTFRLPNRPELSTSLSADEPRYWELEVLAETPGFDYGAVFLLPVYSRK